VHVPAEADGTIPLERFEAAIDERTALVAVTHVCFRNGGRLDVEGVGRIAHEAGAPVLVDAYQTIGSLPIDVARLDCDFLAAGVLKYLLGSAGPRIPLLPPRAGAADRADATGWFADRNIFENGHPRLLALGNRAALRGGHAAGAVDLRGDRGIELMQEIGIARPRRTCAS
jgi:kynureninase